MCNSARTRRTNDDLTLRLLAARGLPVPQAWLQVYWNPAASWEVYELAEQRMDVENHFRRWHFAHLTKVERVIGVKPGSGGTSSPGYLRRALETARFPEL